MKKAFHMNLIEISIAELEHKKWNLSQILKFGFSLTVAVNEKNYFGTGEGLSTKK